MKRLVLQEFVTVDGYAADPDGGMDFQRKYVEKNDVSFQEDALRFLQSVDTMLLGANTYRMFAGYWPEATDEVGAFAREINSLSKYVVSTSLDAAPWGDWEPAEIIRDDVYERISSVKRQEGKDIVVWGSLTLVHMLIRRGLIDEIQLRVCPAVLGDGIPVFPEELDLQLIDMKTYDAGMVLMRYEFAVDS